MHFTVSKNSFDITNLPFITLLYQTGYLTIIDYNPQDEEFTLDYPNREVRVSFQKNILSLLSGQSPDTVHSNLKKLNKALTDSDFKKFFEIIQILFAHIPFPLQAPYEGYYHSLLQLTLKLMGHDAQSEILTDKGRVDLIISIKDTIYIFEIKINSTPQKALQQIEDRKYYQKYLDTGKKISLIGLSFNTKPKRLNLSYAIKEHVVE